MELKLGFVGFGSVARSCARLLEQRSASLNEEEGFTFRATAIATGSHGCVVSSRIDLVGAARLIESGRHLKEIPESQELHSTVELIDKCDADVLFEVSPLKPVDGEPSVSYIRRALSRGISVITANKGPIAFAYRELRDLAVKFGVYFRYEGTVMDGAPVFNLVERCLPSARVLGFSGVLNSTTNLILTGMEEGRAFDDSLAEAKRAGIAEANADYDIDGWDAAVKAVGLANVFMNADLRPTDVRRIGIRDVDATAVVRACERGEVIRLIARASISDHGTSVTVGPELVPRASALGCVRGTSNAIVITTDMMGELAILENDPGVEQTAYALLSDLCSVARDRLSRSRT